jgi:hypothetical protein
VQAHTSYGHVHSDFPVDSSAGPPPGAPRVNLRNQYGNIRIAGEAR